MRIAQWNANGLQQHKEEVKLFLKQNLIDILLVSETHFTTKNYFSIPGYDLCHTCHPDGTAHGGTAIIIKSSLAYNVQPKYPEATIQATTVSASDLLSDITIAAVYCPPRHNLKEEHFAAFFQTLGPRFLAVGDFNSKRTLWGSRLITRKRTQSCQGNTDQKLLLPINWISDIDFFITNGISTNYADVEASYDLTSDHSQVIAAISTTVMTRQPPSRLHTPQTNWDTYKIIISENVELSPKLKTSEHIETATDNFISTLQQAAQLATPIRTPQRPSTTLPLDIKHMVAIKRRARAKWQQTHAPDNRRLYNRASNKLKTALRKLRNDSFASHVTTLRRDENSIWKPIKSRNKHHSPNS